MAGQLTISGLSAGLTTGAKTIGPLSIVGSAVIGEVRDLTLSSGDTTIPVPTGALAVVIQPPAANTQALKLRTNLNSADGGLPISATDPTLYPFRALTPTSLIINAAGTVTGLELSFI